MDSDGSNPMPLTDNDDDFDATPAFAPDGGTIAWLTQEGQQDIWTMDADDGGNKTNLTNTAIAYEAHPEYSPDGTQIAFVNSGHVDGNPIGPYDGNNIWVMDADGSNPTQLTFGSTQSIEPTWSPDGNQIAFTRSDGLWVMNSDGTNPTQFSNSTSIQYPVWSPDGSMFLATFGSEIYTMSAANPVANFANLTNSVVNDTYPAWATAGGPGSEPDTIITKKAKDTTTKKPKATYRFEASPTAGATFECKLDSSSFKSCTSPQKYNGLSKGRHRFQVRASNAGGTDPTPAKDSFKVKKA
jgi:Tol biopolymer transport system component